MKNIILLIALCFGYAHAATKIPGTMLGTGAVASQGATGKVDVQSVFFGGGAGCTTACSSGNCTICSKIGDKITSVSWSAAGVYDLNGIDGTKYICTGSGVSLTALSPWHQRSASTSTKARIVFVNPSNANADTHIASVNCVGIP